MKGAASGIAEKLSVYTSGISAQCLVKVHANEVTGVRCQESVTAGDKEETLSTAFVTIKINNTRINVGPGLFRIYRCPLYSGGRDVVYCKVWK